MNFLKLTIILLYLTNYFLTISCNQNGKKILNAFTLKYDFQEFKSIHYPLKNQLNSNE